MLILTKTPKLRHLLLLLVLVGSSTQIQLLQGADGSGVTSMGNATANLALNNAARDGDTPKVAALIAAGVDVDAINNRGSTALVVAVWHNHIEIVKALIAAGADVNAPDGEGNSALMVASEKDYAAMATALITAGANVNYASRTGATALGYAASYGNLEIAVALIEAGANVNIANKSGNTALWYAAANNHTAILTALMTAGADVNSTNKGGVTALTKAAMKGHADAIAALIVAGAEIPANLNTHPHILAVPAPLRQLPPLVRALISPYHHQALRALAAPSLAGELASCDLSTVDLNVNKFMIRPGTEIVPGGPVATGVTRLETETGPEILPELFSALDLAIYTCQPALVDQLLMAGMDPTQLAQQTNALLEHFNPAIGIAADAKGSEAEIDADSAAIAQMIYHATMARSTEVQNRISGKAGAFAETPLPAPVVRYAQAVARKVAPDPVTGSISETSSIHHATGDGGVTESKGSE